MDFLLRISDTNISLIIYFSVYLWDVLFVGGKVLKLFKINFQSDVEKRVFEFAVGNLILSFLLHYLGIFHLLYKPAILFIYFFPLVFLIPHFKGKAVQFNPLPYITRAFKTSWKTKELIIYSLLAVIFLPLLPHLFAFPSAWDVLAYHLMLPKQFLNDHFFSFYDWFPQMTMPIGIESLFSFGEVVKEPRLANFIVFSFVAALVAYITYGLRYLLPKALLVIVLLLFLFRELLYTAAPIAPFVDYPLSLYSLLMATTLIKFVKAPRGSTLFILLVFSLFTFMVKYTLGLILIVSLLSVMGIYVCFNRLQVKRMMSKLRRNQKIKFEFAIAIFLVPLLFWLGRNFYYTHNPIAPYFAPFWNKLLPVLDYEAENYTSMMATLSNGVLTVEQIKSWFSGAPFNYPNWKEAFLSGVIVLFSGFGLLNKERTIRYLSLFGLLSFLLISLVVGFPAYRYTIAPTVVMSLVAGIVFSNLLRRPLKGKVPLFKLTLVSLFIAALLIQVVSTGIAEYKLFKDTFKRLSKTALSYRSAVRYMYGQDNISNIIYVNKNLDKKRDKVLMVFDNRLYYFDVPVEYANQSVNGLFTDPKLRTKEEIYERVRSKKITHLFINRNWGVYGNLRTDLFDPFVATYLEPISTASGTTLYKLR